jgi:peptidoglycan/LPS O-acetylase OafA/YrhL
VSRLFNNSVISTLAKISFHAYCLHIPVKSVFEILTKQDSFKVFLYAYPWLCMIIFVVTVYAVSYFSYRFIEKPLAGFFSKKGI